MLERFIFGRCHVLDFYITTTCVIRSFQRFECIRLKLLIDFEFYKYFYKETTLALLILLNIEKNRFNYWCKHFFIV